MSLRMEGGIDYRIEFEFGMKEEVFEKVLKEKEK